MERNWPDCKTQKFKMAESVGEELHLNFVNEDDDSVLEKCKKHKERNRDRFLKIEWSH